MKRSARQIRKSYTEKTRRYNLVAEEAPSYRTTASAYRNINDFMKKVPVSTINEYGIRVIRGMRIC
jgi:hypothetical protein